MNGLEGKNTLCIIESLRQRPKRAYNKRQGVNLGVWKENIKDIFHVSYHFLKYCFIETKDTKSVL